MLSERERAATIVQHQALPADLAALDNDDTSDGASDFSLSDDEDEEICDPEETLIYSRKFSTATLFAPEANGGDNYRYVASNAQAPVPAVPVAPAVPTTASTMTNSSSNYKNSKAKFRRSVITHTAQQPNNSSTLRTSAEQRVPVANLATPVDK
jgi:hypothetical protein